MPSHESSYSREEQQRLLGVARAAIGYRLEKGAVYPVDLKEFPASLQEVKASFVTLYRSDSLRGCVGTLEAHRPLVCDVAENAQAAAFRDPRFRPLQASELNEVTVSISVLSKPEPIHFDSEKDLLTQMRPGVDGLVMREGILRGTFLPVMWEQLPDPKEFLAHLKIKAGLSPAYWSDAIKVDRYTSENFSEEDFAESN